MEHDGTLEQGGGNTTSPPCKPSHKSRKWCLTLNNYTDDEHGTMEQIFVARGARYVIGEEKGESGTPHLQAYVEFKNPIAFSSMKNMFPRCHIEKAKGTSEQNYQYCSKEGRFKQSGLQPLKDVLAAQVMARFNDVVWRPWQQDVLDLIEGEADDRTVIWAWDRKGNSGKSFLAKYIVLKHKAIIADGKKDNVFNQVLTHIEAGLTPSHIILDIPRYNAGYENYGTLEQLKNGLIYSGKYEGGQCIFPPPHVLVFANIPPDVTRMSEDRWVIIEVA